MTNSAKKGKKGEGLAEERLAAMGFAFIEKVENAWNVMRGAGGSIVKAWPAAKVAGDFRAIIPPQGRSVLIEVKTTDKRNLRWSDFKEHQPGKLTEHHEAGGLSLIVWVRLDLKRQYVIRWPLPEEMFRKGKSLSLEDAERLLYYDESQLDFCETEDQVMEEE